MRIDYELITLVIFVLFSCVVLFVLALSVYPI